MTDGRARDAPAATSPAQQPMADGRPAPARPSDTSAPGWRRWLPSVATARHYQRRWWKHDVAAGIVLTALLVPAGMGYAEASGLPLVTGLYATIVPLLVYAVVGPSRILVLGPDSALVPLVAAVVVPMTIMPGERVALAGMLAILSGVICIAAGLARFGFLTDLLSTPVRVGYLNGIALTVIVGQLPKLLGFSVPAGGLISETRELVKGIADGRTNTTAFAMGAGSLALIVVLKRVAPKVPGTLIAVVGALIVVPVFDLAAKGIRLVGDLPEGLPTFSIPSIDLGDVPTLLAGAFGIAVVALTDTTVLSRTFAIRGGYSVDPNQELVAVGTANVATGLFQGFSVSASATRTPVAEAAGAKTQFTGVVAALATAALIVFFPDLFRNLPQSVLAAVVIAAAINLIDVHTVVRLWKLRKSELALSLIAFGGVAILGVLPGIGLAVGVALLDFIRRAWRPYSAVLARVDGLKGYHDASRHPEGRRVPGLLLFRFDAPLFFANADYFRQHLMELIDEADPPVRRVVITAEPITDIDTTAADMLAQLMDELERRGITLAFAELKGPVREELEHYGLVDALGPDCFYRTVGQAVHAYVEQEHVPWTDWEDQQTPT
jgi:high affinity sulfate transporter 1